jgi:hypothetical protein
MGESRWRTGLTENISRSGLLFRPDGPLAIDAPLEMRFVLPAGPTPPGVVCRGRVVRTVPTADRAECPTCAVTIAGYRLHRRRPAAA